MPRPLAAALTGLLAACATTGGAQTEADGAVAGCYQFEWTAETAALGLPWGFELLTRPLEGWANVPDGREARTRATEERVQDHPFAFWRPLAGGLVQVGHPGGGGVALTLRREGQDLVGTARTTGDAVSPGEEPGPGPERPVVARRVLCPAPSGAAPPGVAPFGG